MKPITTFLFLLLASVAFGRTVPDSCSAPALQAGQSYLLAQPGFEDTEITSSTIKLLLIRYRKHYSVTMDLEDKVDQQASQVVCYVDVNRDTCAMVDVSCEAPKAP